MEEKFFQCPYCWEQISMLLEGSLDTSKYIEDCEVCCQPIEVSYKTDENGAFVSFFAVSIEQ